MSAPLQPTDPTPEGEWTEAELQAEGRRLRERAFADPLLVVPGRHPRAEAVLSGQGMHRAAFWFQGSEVLLQVSLDLGAPRGAGMLHLSCFDRRGVPLPDPVVAAIVTAVFEPDEQPLEFPSFMHPGRVRQFCLLLGPEPLQ